MKRFIEGEHRNQSTLLPESLDDYIADTNPVRVVDVYVDELNLYKLGFEGTVPAQTGRPSYHPAVLLKIYIYGYLNRIQSSRRLEREAQRNVELMWLTGRLMPDFKTIANFRKDNGKAIRAVCRQFVLLCRQLNLFSESLVAIDGSKFKAVNNRDRNYTSAKLQRQMEEIESSISRYLTMLDTADRQEPEIAHVKAERLHDKIAALKTRMQELKAIEVRLNETPDKQLSLTDPDARSMKTRGTGIVGYNVQTAVDTKHHLIVTHEVTNIGIDRDQLSAMAKQAREVMGIEKLSVVADRGYFKSEEILACHEAGIAVFVPKSVTSNASAEGRFGKDDFIYDAEQDEYRCPAGEHLIWRFSSIERGLKLHRYWSSHCRDCAMKAQCTPSTQRRVTRWEHESVLELMQNRLDHAPDMMRIRRQTVEHPFGTLKSWMGATHFLTRTLKHASTEMSLHVLAYNLKRVMNIMDNDALIKAIREFAAFIYSQSAALSVTQIRILKTFFRKLSWIFCSGSRAIHLMGYATNNLKHRADNSACEIWFLHSLGRLETNHKSKLPKFSLGNIWLSVIPVPAGTTRNNLIRDFLKTNHSSAKNARDRISIPRPIRGYHRALNALRLF